MTQISFTRKRGQAHEISAETREALNARTPDMLETGAASDADNPPVQADRLTRMTIAREVRRIREGVHLSQTQFATTYRIGLGRLRDWEQGRSSPDLPLLAFLRMIDDDPRKAAQVVAETETVFDAA
jgi:Predicted transcriptional regulator